MSIVWYFLAGNIPLPLALVAMLVPRLQGLVAWLGLLTVLVGTFPAFSSSATLVERGSIGTGAGWIITAAYGLTGLAIVLLGIWLRRTRFLPPAIAAVGIVYVASFYAYLPPWGEPDGPLVLLAPGVGLIVLGGTLAWRYGLWGVRAKMAIAP